MITFTIALLLLIGGYAVYGAYVNRVFGPDDRKTPALTMADGVDYIPLPTWKIFMIQFLNIAGLGPIFGAIMGAQFGTASYLWIVLGTIFAGAVHDFFSGALSIRHGGESLPELIGRYLGMTTKKVMTIFTMILMILVGNQVFRRKFRGTHRHVFWRLCPRGTTRVRSPRRKMFHRPTEYAQTENAVVETFEYRKRESSPTI